MHRGHRAVPLSTAFMVRALRRRCYLNTPPLSTRNPVHTAPRCDAHHGAVPSGSVGDVTQLRRKHPALLLERFQDGVEDVRTGGILGVDIIVHTPNGVDDGDDPLCDHRDGPLDAHFTLGAVSYTHL